jgi:dTDP-4-amino-4,6-dideoxygalactose transaminase
MIPMVDLTAQYADLRTEIEQGFREVLDGARFILGPNVEALEREIATYLGAEHAVSCASGTDALHLALIAAGIKPGDKVITTPFTFIATAEAICYVGARPVFVDIDPRTFNLAIDRVEAVVDERTRALLPVHLFGQPTDMARLMDIAQRHDLIVIEDCAQSFGATINGRHTGTVGHAGSFSFFPSKNLGGYGDGGLVTSDSAAFARELRALRNHGSHERYHHHVIGYNSRLDELQAVILRAKLKRIERYNADRRRVAGWYDQRLAGLPELTPPHRDGLGSHVYHQYTVLSPRRDELLKALQAAGIGCAVYYPIPLHRQEVFRASHGTMSLPAAEATARQCLSLPMFPELTEAQVDEVTAVIRRVLTG